MSKFRILVAAALALTLAACGKSAPSPITTDDMVMGSATAPVTVIEYASVACPVCADFNNTQFAAFKKAYIDSGQVKYVFREILAHDTHMAAAGFLTARCAGKDKYFDVVDAIFKDQNNIEGDVNAGLLKVAKQAGLSEDQFKACLADTKAIDALNARVDKNSEEGKITGTPTFDIDGQRIDSRPQPGELEAAVAAAKAKKK
jgi:protein-disulfide isomerase